MWNNELKVALATNDLVKIIALVDAMPKFDNLQEMEEAYYLISQSKSLVESKKDVLLHDMNKIKKNMNFIKSGLSFEK